MDPRAFDDIVRKTTQGASRRAVAGAVAAGLAAALSLNRTVTAGEVEAEVLGLCKFPTAACSKDTQCCSHHCLNGACTCKKKGARCFSAVGLVCCSRRCKKGRCK